MKIKNNNTKVSVIMAVYNTEKYLRESIESILNQSLKELELIIINDNSTDSSLEIIKNYLKIDKRIILINNKKNLGSASSRNKGLIVARGKYIAILDSDDIAFNHRLMFQYNFLENNKNIFLIGSSWMNINEKGIERSIVKNHFSAKKIKVNLPYKSMIHQPTVMFRNEKGIFYRGKFKYAQDRDLWLRFLTENKNMEVLPEILIKYRINSGSVSFNKSFEQRFFIKKAIIFYFQRLEKGVDDYNKFNPNKELKKFDKLEISKYCSKVKIIMLFKNNFGGKVFRRELFIYWENWGLLSWKYSLFYYLVSFLPKFIIKKIILILDNL